MLVRALAFLLLTGCISNAKIAPTAPADGVKVAFIGDTGTRWTFAQVLHLIKVEKADLVVVLGDTDYGSGERKWDRMVKKALGNEAALVVFGNHDYRDSDHKHIAALGERRIGTHKGLECSGEYGEMMTCSYRGVYIVLSSIGADKRPRELHEQYIEKQLDDAPEGHWRVCAWHANQRDMQVGGKNDEIGWPAYETCRKRGAVIATAHEHSYSRTLPMVDLPNKMIVPGNPNDFSISEGVSFVFVSGLGGKSIRDQELKGSHWAKVYTSDQNAKYGALFAEFNDLSARFYFRNIKGEIVDDFKVKREY